MGGMQKDAERLQELAFTQNVAPALRATHLLEDARIAQDRLKDCTDAAMQPLAEQWKALDTAHNRATLRHDDDLQEQYGALIFNTEATVQQALRRAHG